MYRLQAEKDLSQHLLPKVLESWNATDWRWNLPQAKQMLFHQVMALPLWASFQDSLVCTKSLHRGDKTILSRLPYLNNSWNNPVPALKPTSYKRVD